MIENPKLFHNNLPIRATKTGGFSISLNEVNSESSTEFRDIDAVRTTVRTTILLILNEVNSESSTEFRDIDAVWAKRKLRSLFSFSNVYELRYVDAVRTLVRTTIFIILNKKRILFMMLANVFSQTSDRFFPLETFLKFSLSKMPYNEIIKWRPPNFVW